MVSNTGINVWQVNCQVKKTWRWRGQPCLQVVKLNLLLELWASARASLSPTPSAGLGTQGLMQACRALPLSHTPAHKCSMFLRWLWQEKVWVFKDVQREVGVSFLREAKVRLCKGAVKPINRKCWKQLDRHRNHQHLGGRNRVVGRIQNHVLV